MLSAGVDIRTENRIKKGLLGGISLEVTYNHLQWLSDFSGGGFRDIYRDNLFSKNQFKNAQEQSDCASVEIVGNLHYVAGKA